MPAPVQEILSKLEGVKDKRNGGWKAKCPCHDDQYPSLEIDVAADGKILVLCRVCGPGKTPEIIRRLGLEMNCLFPPSSSNGHAPASPRRMVAEFDYVDEEGKVLYQAMRFEPGKEGRSKDFQQRQPGPEGEWIWNMKGVRKVPYRLPALRAASMQEPVWIVEGERKADALAVLGLTATCNVGGAEKWEPCYNEFLAGRQVVILPDNDDAGLRHATQIYRSLQGVAASVVVLELPELLAKGDILDWLRAGGSKEKLLGLLAGVSVNGQIEDVGHVFFQPTAWPTSPREEAYHGLAGEVVHALEPYTEADPVAILVQFLAAFGNAIGRTAFYPVESDRHYTNLYCVLVGRTAKGRKGTSMGRVESIFQDATDPEWISTRIQSGLSSGEGLIWAVRDPIFKKEPIKEKGRIVDYQEAMVDEGVPDKRLLVLEPEFSSVLRSASRDGNTLSAILRQAWDSGKLRSLTKNSPARATGAHVSIIGHITRDELMKCLKETEAVNGFANRFLWLCVRRSKLLPDGGDFLELSRFQPRLSVALQFGQRVERMRRDEGAGALWRKEYARLSAELPGMLGMVTNRSEAQVLRLACIYALLDESDTVLCSHLRAALALWDYSEQSARYVFGESTGQGDSDEILHALRVAAKKGLTLTEISGIFNRHRTATSLNKSLAILLDLGQARREVQPTKGRPQERWYISGNREVSEQSEVSCAATT